MYCRTRPLPRALYLLKTSRITNHVNFSSSISRISRNDSDSEDHFICRSAQNSIHEQKLSNSVDHFILVRLLRYGCSLNPHILSKTISACSKSGFLDLGIQVHSAIIKLGLSLNVYISSALVDMYGKCGLVSHAHKVFDEIEYPNVVTWNSLITVYLQAGCPRLAIALFLQMLNLGVDPTPFTLSGALVGCSQLLAVELGNQLHCLSLKTRFSSNVVVGTGLVDMYSKCCKVEDAKKVFDKMLDRNVFTWTSMVSGYAWNHQPREAMVLVREMLRLDLKPNHVTYNSLLSSFDPYHFHHCKQIHCRIIREGFEANDYIAATLVSVYSECCSSLEDYRKVCSNITISDQISWNAVIAGFSNLSISKDALQCFIKMREANIDVDFFTFTSICRAIGITSALEEGKQIHGLVYKTGHALNLFVQNGLVSMYARCGAIIESKKVFSMMNEHDSISWNSLLTGCAYHGFGKEAIDLFEQMRRTAVKPDDTTFLAVLTACSHVGLLDKGLEYFNLMRNSDVFEVPKVEHYATVVDLFGRAGNLLEAEAFIGNIPIEPGPSIYKALLSACQVHGNKEIAIRTAKKLLELYPHDPATYVLLSNLLVTDGYWDDAARVRKLMSSRGVKKKPGFSWT